MRALPRTKMWDVARHKIQNIDCLIAYKICLMTICRGLGVFIKAFSVFIKCITEMNDAKKCFVFFNGCPFLQLFYNC